MNLHTINCRPDTFQSYQRLADLVSENDSIVLIENAVLAASKNSGVDDLLISLSSSCQIYSLETDLQIRGIEGNIIDCVTPVSFKKFVELTVSHSKVVSWN